MLRQETGITEIRRQEKMLLVEHGQELSSADIIELCVRKGLRIEEAKRSAADLEEIFMHMTGTQE